MTKRIFLFEGPGVMPDVATLETDFPTTRLRALTLLANELYDWAEMALSLMDRHVEALSEYISWLEDVRDTADALCESMGEEDEVDIFDGCDSECYGMVEETLTMRPSIKCPIRPINNPVLDALECMCEFWIDNVALRLEKILVLLLNDGYPLLEIEQHKRLVNFQL